MSRSIEYRIQNYSPAEQTCIQNIESKNLQTFWESSTDSATISLSFELTKVVKVEFCTNSQCMFMITTNVVGNEKEIILEGRSTCSAVKCSKIIDLNYKEKLTNLEFTFTTLDSKILKIYYLGLTEPRDDQPEESIRKSQPSPGITNFYSKSQGIRPLPTKPSYSTKPSVQSNPKTYSNQNLRKVTSEKTRGPENFESAEEQMKIYESIQKNRQKKNAELVKNTPTNSYCNLMEHKTDLIICCLDEALMKETIEEICQVVGICYFSELEPDVSYIIYNGDDTAVFHKAEEMGIKIVSKEWLFKSVDLRTALDPRDFIRNFRIST